VNYDGVSCLEAGETLQLGEKTFTVMGSLMHDNTYLEGSNSPEASFTFYYLVPLSVFDELFPGQCYRQLAVDIDHSQQAPFEAFLNQYEQGVNRGISITLRSDYQENFENSRLNMVLIIGMVGAVLLGIAVLNFINLLVTQTMSKSRSLAGGRVGYALGSPALIEDLNRVKYSFHPYNVNRLSMAAGAAAVADEAYFAACTAAIRQTRAWTVGELENLGFAVLPSQANFVFARHEQISGETLYRKLKENGILVRWFDVDRIRDYVRITIGSMEQMETLVEELTALLEWL